MHTYQLQLRWELLRLCRLIRKSALWLGRLPIPSGIPLKRGIGLRLAGIYVDYVARSVRLSNNRFERSRGRIFVGPRRESMIGINQLRWPPTQPRVAQPHR
jgi:hypothetical protein